MRVLKFGGTSVADPGAIRRAGAIVAAERGARVIVVSALAGVTDELLRLGQVACRDLEAALAGIDSLVRRHLAVAAGALPADRGEWLAAGIDGTARTARASLVGIANAGASVPPAPLGDRLAAAGELWSSRIVAALFEGAGLRTRWVDARQVVRTDGVHQGARADLAATAREVDRRIRPALACERVVVVGGFIGSGPDGATTTLGRGGSDYSAAVLGACLLADEIQIWTDVDGVLTADPRLVTHARTVERLSYAEAHDLATFGAKVLHPATIQPAALHGIPLRVLNAQRPDTPGTLIGPPAPGPRQLRTAVACRRGVTLLELVSRDGGPPQGFAAAIFQELARRTTPVLLADLCGNRLALAVDDTANLDGFADAVAPCATVELRRGLAAVCAVGRGWPPAARLLGDALALLGDIPIHMIARPSAASAFAVVVDPEHAAAVMTRLHDGFFHATSEACA